MIDMFKELESKIPFCKNFNIDDIIPTGWVKI
jgi:hypothetical protein